MTGTPAWRFPRPALLAGLPFVAVMATAAVVHSQTAQPPLPVPPPAAPAPSPSPAPTSVKPTSTAEWMALPIDDLRALAYGDDGRAMEELARRLISGIGIPKDSQSGAGWLLRAAQAGSPTAAFNVGVMYERGFVVERDSAKAVEWYQKAVDGNVAVAKHNLALLLRDGKGAPRDGKKAIELLRSAVLQGMAASMFALGDIYERGDAASKDIPLALAWFAITVEFERQVNHAAETPLAKTAQSRVETLHHILTPEELDRAERIGRAELQHIFAALAPSTAELPPGPSVPSAGGLAAAPAPPAAQPSLPPDDDRTIGWPKAKAERVRAIQQALIDLRRLNGKADGIAGPATRAAIIDFEKSAGLRETGEASRAVYVAALRAIAQNDAVTRSPLPLPPRTESPFKTETPKPPPKIDSPAPQPPKVDAPEPSPRIDLGTMETPPPPPTSAEIARLMARTEPTKPDVDAWPTKRSEQIRAIQVLLGQLKLMRTAPTGEVGPVTSAAIREYQRTAGLPQTGEPSRGLFESLKAARSLAARQPTAKPD